MFGGKECDGNETRTEVCNMNSCPGRHNILIGIYLPLILLIKTHHILHTFTILEIFEP